MARNTKLHNHDCYYVVLSAAVCQRARLTLTRNLSLCAGPQPHLSVLFRPGHSWCSVIIRVSFQDLLCKGILRLGVVQLGSGTVKSKNVDVTIAAKRDRFNMGLIEESFTLLSLIAFSRIVLIILLSSLNV